ncbi:MULTISPECIES: BPSS1780 family membrane protein [unclassified Pigmentiphaga]|jgi:hypothetical protein|uniref:BPSS1780 family membrane protein n=1 Tax=unclassified Pigmentiphaga TaxID=2626614 RepID=UPI0010502608|nr:BPSS1780 family membrane protein [Pigmentiphaga sp. D-2]
MQAASLAPSAGWQWARDGLALFRLQPMAMFTWALTVGFMVLVASILAPIGPLLFVVGMPAITVMTLEACRAIEQGRTVLPLRLFLVLKAPGLFKKLLAMGALYVAAVLAAGLVAFLPFADGLSEAMSGLSSDDVGGVLAAMRAPIALFGIFYVIIAGLFWHAPALVAWHRLGIRKALFFSGIACWRNKGAFLMYGATWLLVVLALELGGGLLEAVGLSPTISGLIQMPFNFVAAAVLYCSFYPTYTSVFGAPPAPGFGNGT